MGTPKLRVTFDEPRDGWWDGGKKSGGDVEPEVCNNIFLKEHPGKDQTIRWGCFYLNFWFNCGSGRSWKEAAAIAKRKLIYMIRTPATIEVVWEEV